MAPWPDLWPDPTPQMLVQPCRQCWIWHLKFYNFSLERWKITRKSFALVGVHIRSAANLRAAACVGRRGRLLSSAGPIGEGRNACSEPSKHRHWRERCELPLHSRRHNQQHKILHHSHWGFNWKYNNNNANGNLYSFVWKLKIRNRNYFFRIYFSFVLTKEWEIILCGNSEWKRKIPEMNVSYVRITTLYAVL